jgi:two-component system nitrate/nitrite response regulator NarL
MALFNVYQPSAKTLDGGPQRNKPLLSDREKQVVRLVSQGGSNKEIGKDLFISEQTVKNHLH